MKRTYLRGQIGEPDVSKRFFNAGQNKICFHVQNGLFRDLLSFLLCSDGRTPNVLVIARHHNDGFKAEASKVRKLPDASGREDVSLVQDVVAYTLASNLQNLRNGMTLKSNSVFHNPVRKFKSTASQYGI